MHFCQNAILVDKKVGD